MEFARDEVAGAAPRGRDSIAQGASALGYRISPLRDFVWAAPLCFSIRHHRTARGTALIFRVTHPRVSAKSAVICLFESLRSRLSAALWVTLQLAQRQRRPKSCIDRRFTRERFRRSPVPHKARWPALCSRVHASGGNPGIRGDLLAWGAGVTFFSTGSGGGLS